MRRRGFSLLETIVVAGIVATLSAVTVPRMLSTVDSLELSAAAASVQGGIQATRYLAIMHGYPYQLVLTSGTTSYQITSKAPPATTFSNVGGLVPFTGVSNSANKMTVTSNTLQFLANGGVSATTGSMSFQITYKNATRTIGVSANGYVSVTTP